MFSALAAPRQPATNCVEQSNVETKQWLATEGGYVLKWFAYGLTVISLSRASTATEVDCESMLGSYARTGTTAQVTIFNGQGAVSYAEFTLQFHPETGNDPRFLSGRSVQLFNDRKSGVQPFDAAKADQLAMSLIWGSCAACDLKGVRANFNLLTWNTVSIVKDFSCPSAGYLTGWSGGGLYVISLRKGP